MDQTRVSDELYSRGYADLGLLLADSEIDALTALYPRKDPFRSHIIMQRHGFGEGEYKYFTNPLPKPVLSLRAQLYSSLAPIANEWQERLGIEMRYPKRTRKCWRDATPMARPDRRH